MSTIQVYTGMDANETIGSQLQAVQQTSPALATGCEPMIMGFPGIASGSFTVEQQESLLKPLDENEIEVRPDGLLYLPEIRYRRILNRVFGPGAWAIQPRGITLGDGDNMLYYRGALFIHGRFIAEAIGEQEYFPNNERQTYGTAAESAKSNCLVRCCKDLGIASELWDPVATRKWIQAHAVEVWCVHRQEPQKRKRWWRKKNDPPVDSWPWIEIEEGRAESMGHRKSSGTGKSHEWNRRETPAKGPEPASSTQPAVGAGEPAKSAPGAPETPVRYISHRQAGRFNAIGRNSGWNEQQLNLLLRCAGFPDAERITVDAYEKMCGYLTMPGLLERFQKKSLEEA